MRLINECVSDLLPTFSTALSAAIGPLIGLPAQQATLGGQKLRWHLAKQPVLPLSSDFSSVMWKGDIISR